MRTLDLNVSGTVSARGGAGGVAIRSQSSDGGDGGKGADGRIRIDYGKLIQTGTITPNPGYRQQL